MIFPGMGVSTAPALTVSSTADEARPRDERRYVSPAMKNVSEFPCATDRARIVRPRITALNSWAVARP